MSDFHGQFCWCELMTTDDDAASKFYCAVIGWNARESGAEHMRYTLFNAGETGVGGVLEIPPNLRAAGVPPHWVGYIAVDDVDATAALVEKKGGAIHHAPDDIPAIGRFAVVADPQGAVFTLFKPLTSGPTPHPYPPANARVGHIGWHELHALDREAAFAFYAGLFGWTKTEAVDIGAMGIYQTFATNGITGPHMTGGMMTKTEATPKPVWFYYFNVDEIEAAVSRTKSAGGEVLMGPHEVPGGSWIAQCRDPQGALFCMTGPRR